MFEKVRRFWPSFLITTLFVLMIVAQFWRALIGRVSVTKLNMLAEWDSLFAAQHTNHPMLMDPSLILLMIPYYLFKCKIFRAGDLPLWNPYSGLGCPLAADPQTLAYTPLHLPMLFEPGMTGWPQVLVLELVILGLSTFALARNLGLGRIASTFAMLCIAFCPYERHYLEILGNGYCFVPLVFWLILRLRKDVTPLKIWLTGFGCAMMVLSSHPELTFFAIGIPSIALMAIAFIDRKANANSGSNADGASGFTWLKSIGGLVASGIIAFMLSAPLLIPFFEYLKNSDCYKYGNAAPAVIRLQTTLWDLWQPGFGGASPTLAAGAIALFPLLFCVAKRHKTIVSVFSAMAISCLLLVGKIWPIELLLSKPPLSYVVVDYAYVSLLLAMAILAAFGLETALSSIRHQGMEVGQEWQAIKINNWVVAASVLLAAGSAIFPWLATTMHWSLISANWDMCLPDYGFNRNDIVRYAAAAGLVGLSIAAVKFKPSRFTGIFLTVAAALGVGCEAMVAARSIPPRPPFAYQENVIVPQLRKDCGYDRFIATSNYLFRPNSNVVFELADLRTHNPLFPMRYLKYVDACGAKLDKFNQVFDNPLSPLLSIASVKMILSHNAVVGRSEIKARGASSYPKMSVEIEKGAISADFEPLIIDAQKQVVTAKITIKAPPGMTGDLSYNLVLCEPQMLPAPAISKATSNKAKSSVLPGKPQAMIESAGEKVGKIIWSSPSRRIELDAAAPRMVTIPTPLMQSGKDVIVGIQVFNKVTQTWLSPKGNNKKTELAKIPFIFGRLKMTAAAADSDKGDYRLVFESADHLRIYDNRGAMPRTYVVHRARAVDSPEAALTAIQDPLFKPQTTVILESAVKGHPLNLPANPEDTNQIFAGTEAAKISQLKPNSVQIACELHQSGYLVLTDVYYPGWEVEVDGKPAQIMPANYVGRAVPVEAGKHTVLFSYKPISFTVGLYLSIAGLLAGLIALGYTLNANRRGHSSPQDDRSISSPE